MSRRAPLTNLPNAVNSPFQSTTAKRARSQSGVPRGDHSYGQPPAKKQATESTVLRTTTRRAQAAAESKVAPPRKTLVRKRSVTGGPPTFADGAIQSRKQQSLAKVGTDAQQQQNLDSIRAWQRHYRKTFPSFVFYFESIPSSVVAEAQRHIQVVGASYEKFFSSKVTHVITARPIPPDSGTQPTSATSRAQARTVNPALIHDKNGHSTYRKSASTSRGVYEEIDLRRGSRTGNDILQKAREYGMRVWSVDKLERVLNGLQDIPTTYPTLTGHLSRGGQPTQTHERQNNDLSYLLRNERLHGPTDRDPNATPKELHYFKGPFIYVRDILSANRPIIVKEYTKVQRRDEGDWPQFRSVSGFKCPFIDESAHQKREETRERGRQQDSQETAMQLKEREHREKEKQKEREKAQARHTQDPTRLQTKAEASAPPPAKRSIHRQENAIAFTSTNQQKPNRYTGEPAASGVQPSNITSAIRSQVISSHLDAPGQRAGVSKEIYGLQRKVAGNVLAANPSNKVASAVAKRSALDTVAGVPDKKGPETKRAESRLETKKVNRKARENRELATAQAAIQKKQNLRPGYCENCREKFDDFEDHTVSRKHRKFATDSKNWAELDELLSRLGRPLKREHRL